MASKAIVIFILAFTAIQGLNADTLLKRDLFSDIANGFKNFTQGIDDGAKIIGQHIAEDFNKTKDAIHGAEEKLKNIFDNIFNHNSAKRSPLFFGDNSPLEGIVSNIKETLNGSKGSPLLFKDIDKLIKDVESEFKEMFNVSKRSPLFFDDVAKRSPMIFGDIDKLVKDVVSDIEGTFNVSKRSPLFFEAAAAEAAAKQLTNNFTSTVKTGKRSPFLFDGTSIVNAIKQIQNESKACAEKAKQRIEEDREKFAEFVKNVTDKIFNSTATSKRSIVDDIKAKLQELKNKTDEKYEKVKEDLAEKVQEGKQKFEEIVKKIEDFFKGGNNSSKRSLFEDIINKTKEDIQNARAKAQEAIQQAIKNFEQFFKGNNAATSKRSIVDDIKAKLQELKNKTDEKYEKVKEDLAEKVQEGKQKFEEIVKKVEDFFKGGNNSSKRSLFEDIIEKTKEDIQNVRAKVQEDIEQAIKNFQQFFNGNNQDKTTSKRSISFNSGLTILQNFQNSLAEVVQKIKAAVASNANNTNILDTLKNISSNIVSARFNLSEITADIKKCADSEKQNATDTVDNAKAALKVMMDKEEQEASPFVANVSATVPKIANLIMQTSASAATCGQNYICIVSLALQVYQQAQALQPEVTQEIQQGWALIQDLSADAKVIQEQILAPAAAEMKAIAEETIACIEGKLDA